jgi:hypothetical protein
MSGAADAEPRAPHRRTTGLAELGRRLGVELPPLKGPLVVFDLAAERDPGDPVYLGGDLHANRPDGRRSGGRPYRDESLDLATVTLLDGEGRVLDVPATDGVWCTRLEGRALERAPYFLLTDSEGRLRIWLFLPPPHQMLGIPHSWLPRIPPPGGPAIAPSE